MSNHAYRFACAAAALLGGAYLLTFVYLAPLPLQDYPNHLARAVVMNDLLFHHGVKFGSVFHYHFLAAPYILNDWLLSSLMEFTSIKTAGTVWPVLVFFSFPFALLYYMRSVNVPREEQVLAFMLALYLATNTFFIRGFLAFSLGVSSILVVMGQIQTMRAQARAGLLRYSIYVVSLLAAYLIHLSTLVFITAAAAVTMALNLYWRAARPRTVLQIMVPIVALLLWHLFFNHVALGASAEQNQWASVLHKFQYLDWDQLRFTRRTDRGLLCIFAFCCAGAAWRAKNARFPTELTQQMALLTLTFIGLYFALPLNLGNATWVDVRALPMMAVFAMLTCFTPPVAALPRSRGSGFAMAVVSAAFLALVNLIYLAGHFQQLEQRAMDYRAVLTAVPKDSWVLPVYTNTTERPIKSNLHVASFAVIDRQAWIPYLFSRDLGDPMQYFSYSDKPYAPDEDWYTDVRSDPVDWPAIRRSYDFVLVMKPFDSGRIPLKTLPAFENSAAALFAVGPRLSVSQGTAH